MEPVTFWPATVGGHPRTVSLEREKCYRPSCLTRTGTRYGIFPTCNRHANEDAALERADEERKRQEATRV